MKKYLFWLIIFGAIIFRILMARVTFHQDLLSQASWGEYISQTGTKGFYTHNVWIFSWPNHPPLTSLYYGYCYKVYLRFSLRLHQSLLLLKKIGIKEEKYSNFVNSFKTIVSPEKPYPLGFLLCLKLFPILFDVLIGALIFYLANINKVSSFKYLLIYLLSPFSWYISSLWGQTDQISVFLTLISFLLIVKYTIPAIVIFFLGISIKPTVIFLVPLFIFILIKNKIRLDKIVIGGLISLFLLFYIFNFFTNVNIIDFTFKILLPRIFDRPPRLTTNSYNFWHIFALDRGWSDQKNFFWIPANIWSILFYIYINLIAFRLVKVKNNKSMFGAIFTVGFGSWLFLTNMLDRYSFIGIVSCLISSIYNPKIFKYWIILSIIYWLNLYRGWWFPEFIWPLKHLLTTNNYIAGFFLSITNVYIYIKIIQILLGNNFCPDHKIKLIK